MRKFCWVYQDKFTNDLVLVQRPRRRSAEPAYRVMAGHWKRNGFRPETLIAVSVGSVPMLNFLNRYSFVGRMNG